MPPLLAAKFNSHKVHRGSPEVTLCDVMRDVRCVVLCCALVGLWPVVTLAHGMDGDPAMSTM